MQDLVHGISVSILLIWHLVSEVIKHYAKYLNENTIILKVMKEYRIVLL